MLKIEINDTVLHVPESWGDITLGHYETYYKLKPESSAEKVALIAKIVGVDAELLRSWPAEVFNLIYDTVRFVFADNPYSPSASIKIGAETFTVPIEDDISLGAWVDAEETQKAGENVLSGVLAIVCRPVGETYNHKISDARQLMFQAQTMDKILPVLGFFLHLETSLNRLTAIFTGLHQTAARLPRHLERSPNLGGGIGLLQTWQRIKYYCLIKLLNYRLRRLSRFYRTNVTSASPRKRKTN